MAASPPMKLNRPRSNTAALQWVILWTHPLDIDQRPILIVDELRRKLGTLLRVRTHDVLQEADEVGAVSDLLGVQDDFLRLTGLSEACDDLVRHIGTKVDAERKGEVVQSHNITELFAAGELQTVN